MMVVVLPLMASAVPRPAMKGFTALDPETYTGPGRLLQLTA